MRPQSRIIVVFILLAVAVSLVGWWFFTYTIATETEAFKASHPQIAPNFSWQALDGTRHNYSELHGQTVVLHFWASWCEPCQEEFPELLKAAAKLNGKVVFLTLSSDDNKAAALKFIRAAEAKSKIKAPSNMLYGFDPQKTVTFDIFQTMQYPESVVLDSSQHLRRKFPGVVDWNSADIQNYLKQLQ